MFHLFYLNTFAIISYILVYFYLLIHQTFCVMHTFLQNKKCDIFLNVCVEGYLLVHLLIVSQVFYFTDQHLVVLNEYLGWRYLLFVAIVVFSCIVSWNYKDILSLLNIGIAILTLPIVLDSFPILFFIATVGWLFLILRNLIVYKRQSKQSISIFSIKEAVDTLDFGLLYYQEDGTIVLCNTLMKDIIFQLYHRRYYNANLLVEELSKNNSDQVLFLQDECWKFEIQKVNPYHLLVTYNISEYKKINDELYRKEKVLQQRNEELIHMLQNLESSCKTNELIRMKNQVHDILGQRISIMLRTIRDHKEPDEQLLKEFSKNLIHELKEIPEDYEYSLPALSKDFESLGVEFTISGCLPKNKRFQKVFYEIALESITNAIRHGYATKIHIQSIETDVLYQLTIENNGIIKDDTIVEGGGIANMRRKMEEIHGRFSYETKPVFKIIATVEKKGEFQ